MSLHPETRRSWPPLPLPTSPEAAEDDWNVLFGAVTDRLRRCVGEALDSQSDIEMHQLASHVQAGVLDCVAALEQVRAMLAGTLAQGRQREHELHVAQDRLARLGAELEGSRSGERQARHRALHDELTTLPNRACFREVLERSLARAGAQSPGLAVLFLDLDEFKLVNDKHGHGAGDQLLRIVAARMLGLLRVGDIVGRLGGDEFACLLHSSMNREQLSHLACKLLDAVGEPVQIGQAQFTVRLSIGVAVYPSDGISADALLKHADAAMYRAKRQRSGYAFFDGVVDV